MSLFTPANHPYTNYYDKERYLLAWRVSLLFTIVFLIVTGMYSYTGFEAALPSGLVVVVGIFCLLYLRIKKNYRPMFWIYVLAGTGLSHYAMNTVLNLTHYVDFIWMINTILLAFIGIGRTVGLVFTVLHIILVTGFFLFTLNDHILTMQPRTNTEMIGELVEIGFAFTVLIYLARQYVHFLEYTNRQLQEAYTELSKQNSIIQAKNRENVLLLKEVHHRVKNNLQIITSLLRLQGNQQEPEVSEKFEEANNRIMSMALIHQKLYQQDNFTQVDTDTYIEELVNYIMDSYQSGFQITKKIKSDISGLGLNTIVPLGLLLNELISNTFKHAFKPENEGQISIELKPGVNGYFILLYSDTGEWKHLEKRSTFGMNLMEALTEQMEGNCERKDSTYKFTLRNLDLKQWE